jgi:hypothetical protein
MTSYGTNATGILFTVVNNPLQNNGGSIGQPLLMPDLAVADLGALPTTLTSTSTAADWEAWPQFVAKPFETELMFRLRIAAALQAAGTVGVVITIWARNGFFHRNQAGALLSGNGY